MCGFIGQVCQTINPDYFLRKLRKGTDEVEVRTGAVHLIPDIIHNPDEVWENKNTTQSALYRAVYFKHYQDMTLVAVTQTEADSLKIMSLYELTLTPQIIGNLRNGVLMHKKSD